MRRALLLLDPAAVMLFVAVGRDTHAEPSTWSGLGETAAPFLIAMAAGWLAARVWARPETLSTGAVIAFTTIVLGIVLRNLVFDEGTAPAFVLVASLFLGGTILGWRLVAGRFR
jgi:hypothetical protein